METRQNLLSLTDITIEIVETDDPEQNVQELDFEIVQIGTDCYQVLSDLNDVGILQKQKGRWIWLEGNYSQQYAYEIGKAIEELKEFDAGF